jgi:hypothetical protein
MKKRFILLMTATVILASCNDNICERGRGREETETFTVAEFDGIDISTASDIEIIQSNEHKFEIEAQPNVIDQFRYNVRNKVLSIKSDCFHTSDNPDIKIYCSNLNMVHFSGSGKVSSASEFVSEDFDIQLSGSAKIQLKGQTKDLSIRVSGSGDVNVKELSSENCDVNISGSSRCDVKVSDKLDVKISGSGDVFYIGNPSITQKISGSGSVRSLN